MRNHSYIGRLPFYGLIAFAVSILASRVVMERALKLLSIEEKARLLDSFSSYRMYNFAAILLLIVLNFAAMRYLPASTATTSLVFIGLLLVIAISVSVLSYRKLKRLELPTRYINNYLLSLGIQYIGLAFLFAPIVAEYVG